MMQNRTCDYCHQPIPEGTGVSEFSFQECLWNGKSLDGNEPEYKETLTLCDECAKKRKQPKQNIRSVFSDSRDGIKQIIKGLDVFKPENDSEKKIVLEIQDLALELYHLCSSVSC